MGVVLGGLGLLSGILMVIALAASVAGLYLGARFAYVLFGTAGVFWADAVGVASRSMPLRITVMILTFFVPALAVAGGAGVLGRRPWAKPVLMTYSISKIALDTMFLLIALIMAAVASDVLGIPGDIMAGAMVIVVLLILVSLVYPIAALVVMSKSSPTSARRSSQPLGAPTMYASGPPFSGGATPRDPSWSSRSTPPPAPAQAKVTQQLKPVSTKSALLVVVSGRDLNREYTIGLEDFQGCPVRNVIGSSPECQVIISGDPRQYHNVFQLPPVPVQSGVHQSDAPLSWRRQSV